MTTQGDNRDVAARPRPYEAGFAWANFCKMVFYGYVGWPSYSYWIVPGTITDVDRCGTL